MEHNDELLMPGHRLDTAPFALDLYRLLCMVLADKRTVTIGSAAPKGLPATVGEVTALEDLRDHFRDSEVTRILISTSAALRILFDQHPRKFTSLSKESCGQLWPLWPKQQREALTLREASNKIIHARRVNPDLVIPYQPMNPDETGTYIRPFVFLYGERNGQDWRAKLSIIDFVRCASVAFQ